MIQTAQDGAPCSSQNGCTGSAPRAPSRCSPARRSSPRQGRSIINLGIGQPDFPTPENIVDAAQKALADGHHGYTPANGILPLREAVAEDILKWRGVEVDPDRIVIVPGGKVTMYFAITMFGEPGTEIMYPGPGLSDLPLGDRVHRRQGGADPALRGERLLVLGRGGAGQDHARAPG